MSLPDGSPDCPADCPRFDFPVNEMPSATQKNLLTSAQNARISRNAAYRLSTRQSPSGTLGSYGQTSTKNPPRIGLRTEFMVISPFLVEALVK